MAVSEPRGAGVNSRRELERDGPLFLVPASCGTLRAGPMRQGSQGSPRRIGTYSPGMPRISSPNLGSCVSVVHAVAVAADRRQAPDG
eukprot:scaffold83934_cov66-Phaeocystis_antarctica.AAC.2